MSTRPGLRRAIPRARRRSSRTASIRAALATALAANALGATACPSNAAAQRAGVDGAMAITHVTVVGIESDTSFRDATVLVRGGRIVSVGDASRLSVPREARVVDGRGKFVVPGLWDAHVHLTMEGRQALPMYLRRGITSVRDMGSRFEDVDVIRRDIARGAVAGPRIVASGPMIESPKAMEDLANYTHGVEKDRLRVDRVEVADSGAARRVVDSLAALGVDFIKGRDFADVGTYWAVASAARRAGRALMGHAPFGLPVDPIALADSGQRTIEHWYFPTDLFQLPNERRDQVIAAFARSGTALVPTLTAWHQHRLVYDVLRRRVDSVVAARGSELSPALIEHWRTDLEPRRTEGGDGPLSDTQLEGWRKVLLEFARASGTLRHAGVPVLAGSDLPMARLPGDALHDELVLLVHEAGLTPREALEAATAAPARAFGMRDSLGVVAPGMVADLVVLDADPLADIENVRRIYGVMLGGRWLPRGAAERHR